MPVSQRTLLTATLSIVAGLSGCALHFLGFLPLQRLENYSRDLRAIFGRKTPIAEDFVLLTIDSASLHLDGLLDDESGPEFSQMRRGWPWPRSVYAALLEKLTTAGAKVVAFDLIFPEVGAGDAEFSAALAKYSDRAVLGASFSGTDTGTPSFSRPTESLLSHLTVENLGFANFVPDNDGTVRAALFHATPEDFASRPRLAGEPVFDSLAANILRKISPQIDLPDGRNVPFRYGGAPASYRHYSLYEVFVPRLWQQNFKNGQFFKGKTVVIGPEGSWSHDEHPTPFTALLGTQGLMSGPEIHLHALAAARAGEYLHLPGIWMAGIFIAGAAALGALLNFVAGSPLRRFTACSCIVTAYWIVGQVIFNERGLLLPLAAPLLVFSTTVFVGILFEFSRERLERLRSRATLERYVSSHVASEILDNPQSYLTSLVGVRKEVTVLFADLRNFTAMVNLINAPDLVTQLNEYYARVIEDVFEHSGTLDKIMGDGMMAIWGNLRSDGVREDAVHAVGAALAIQNSLAALNREWALCGKPALTLGIGIAQGECIVGNVGSERKMDLTVIGEAANLAARLQSLTRECDAAILFDQRVARLVENAFPVEPISTFNIRGFDQPIPVFSVSSPASIAHPPLQTAQLVPG